MSNDNRRLLNPNPNPERVLSIPVKKSDPVELYEPLRKLVATKYSERDAQKVESVLETLNKCRRDMVERVDLSLPMQRDCLIHYFKCLCMVEPLFTAISSDSDYDFDPIIFVWYDALRAKHEHGVSSQRNSIQLEKASVLFNLGAVCSQIGDSCDRTTALGRHLAMDAFNDAANFFLKLWKVFAMDVSATLDLTFLFAKSLHSLFSAQCLELELQNELDNTSDGLQQHRFAVLFKLISEHYRRAFDLLLSDSAVNEYVVNFDKGWITHLDQKLKFFLEEACQRQSSILPKSERPETFKVIQLSPLGRLLRGICVRADQWIPKQQRKYLDFILSEHSPFRIIDGGMLVAKPWDMPPPYPTNLTILSPSSSFSSHMLAIPLKKSEPLDLYDSLHNYFVLTYSESVAKSVEGFLKILNKLRSEMHRDDLSLPIRRECHIHYFKCLCMIETFFPMTTSPNPPIFVWYNAFNAQQNSSQHNIHLEKSSVLFNLGALCTLIARSCDLTTIQGHHVAMDALNDASHWFFILPLEAEKVSATIDLSLESIQMLREIITAQIADLKGNPHYHSDGSSLAGYPVSLSYQKAYNLLTSGPLAKNHVQSWTPQLLKSKIKTSLVQTGPSDITEQFLSGYCEAQSLLRQGCQTPCLDLLSKFGPLKIMDGNIVANLRGSNFGIGGDELARDHHSNAAMEGN